MTSRNDNLLLIQRALRGLHRRNRSVVNAYGLNIDMLESAVMGEVAGCPGVSSSTLASNLLSSQVAISRAVSALTKRGLLSVSLDPSDGRRRQLELSSQGSKLYSQILERARVAFSTAMARVPKSEEKLFAALLRRFLNGLNAPQTVSLPNDPPLMREVRQITRLTGLLGREVFGIKGLSPLKWQVLSSICTAPNGVTLSQLATLIGASRGRLFALLQQMERSKAIVKRRQGASLRIYPSKSGIKEHMAIESIGVLRLMPGGRALSDRELATLARLWGAFTGEGLYGEERFLGEGKSLRFVRSSRDRAEVRSFIIAQRAQQQLLLHLPEAVASTHSLIFSMRSARAITACAEFAKVGADWHAVHLLCSDTAQSYQDFIAYAFEQFFDASRAKLVLIPRANTSHALTAPIQHWLSSRGGSNEKRKLVRFVESVRYE